MESLSAADSRRRLSDVPRSGGFFSPRSTIEVEKLFMEGSNRMFGDDRQQMNKDIISLGIE